MTIEAILQILTARTTSRNALRISIDTLRGFIYWAGTISGTMVVLGTSTASCPTFTTACDYGCLTLDGTLDLMVAREYFGGTLQ